MRVVLLLFLLCVGSALGGNTNITYSTKGADTSYPVSLNGLNLLSASMQDVSLALSNGTVTTVQLVDAYLARQKALDHRGLNLRSIIEIAPTAREIARQLDEERANGTVRSGLHGVPIVVKDNYNTAPELGMNTTAGSYSLLGQTVTGDAFVVSKLRDAGLLILGKANLDEFAGMMGKDNSSGFSARGGQASAAYVVGGFAAGGDPSGSSGGSAISVSAGFAAASLGTDTDDSIVIPANRAALFGLRPSTGLTSRTGVVPLSLSQDATGPLAKSTWDIAALLSIMAVHDEEDSYSLAAEPFRKKDYTVYLKEDGFKGLRIGVPRYPFFNASITGTRSRSEAIPAVDEALVEMQRLGAIVIDPVTFPNAEGFTYAYPGLPERSNNETTLLQYDLKEDLAIYLQTKLHNTTMKTLQDIIIFNEAHSHLEFPPGQCCQATFLNANNLPPRASSAEYWISQWHQQRLDVEGTQAVMRKHDLDLLVVPTEGYSARIGAIGRRPVGTVPLGYDGINLPFGMAFVGKSYDEGTVLRAMYAFEMGFPKRRVPPTLD